MTQPPAVEVLLRRVVELEFAPFPVSQLTHVLAWDNPYK
jgi:hypothetical protein